jgi:hypothetical protein
MNALAQEYEENQRQPTLPEVIIQQGDRNPEIAEADLEEIAEADPEEIAEANPDVRSDPEGGMENNPETEMNPEVIGGNDALVNPKTNLEASMDDDLEANLNGRVYTRSGRMVYKPSHFIAVTKISKSDWKEKYCESAIKQELSQLFQELKAL